MDDRGTNYIQITYKLNRTGWSCLNMDDRGTNYIQITYWKFCPKRSNKG